MNEIIVCNHDNFNVDQEDQMLQSMQCSMKLLVSGIKMGKKLCLSTYHKTHITEKTRKHIDSAQLAEVLSQLDKLAIVFDAGQNGKAVFALAVQSNLRRLNAKTEVKIFYTNDVKNIIAIKWLLQE